MRVIIIKGIETQRYEISDDEWSLQVRAATLTVESHNSLHPEDWWVWGEGETFPEPTLEKSE